MNTRLIVSCTLGFSLGATLLLADEQWKNKTYIEWTLQDVQNILEDSPWSHTKRTAVGVPGESGMSAANRGGFTTATPGRVGTNTEGRPTVNPGTVTVKPPAAVAIKNNAQKRRVDRTIQWQSSRTVREALLRKKVLNGIMTNEEMSALLAAPSSDYVIAVSGDCLAKMLGGGDLTLDVLLQSVHLRSKQTKAQVHPFRVTNGAMFSSAEELPQSAISPKMVMVVFYFQKESDGHPVIGPADKEIEFRWALGENHVQTTFDLRMMMRDGKPDL